jgi:hypothetical protein
MFLRFAGFDPFLAEGSDLNIVVRRTQADCWYVDLYTEGSIKRRQVFTCYRHLSSPC